MITKVYYEIYQRCIGSYRVRKYINGVHDPMFNCIIENDSSNDTIAKKDAELVCDALNKRERSKK